MTPELRQALKKRGRTWGSENAARIRAMRKETKRLKKMPKRWVRAVSQALSCKRSIGHGCFVRSRTGGFDSHALRHERSFTMGDG